MIKNLESLCQKLYKLMARDQSVAIKVTFTNEESLDRYKKEFLNQFLNPSWYNIYGLTVIVFLDIEYGIHTASNIMSQAIVDASYYGAIKGYII